LGLRLGSRLAVGGGRGLVGLAGKGVHHAVQRARLFGRGLAIRGGIALISRGLLGGVGARECFRLALSAQTFGDRLQRRGLTFGRRAVVLGRGLAFGGPAGFAALGLTR